MSEEKRKMLEVEDALDGANRKWIDVVIERMGTARRNMIPDPLPESKRVEQVDLRMNPRCFGTDPNLPDCTCQIIYEELVRKQKGEANGKESSS